MVGIGNDVHPLKKGRKLVLGGVTIPYPMGLDGHSDADVLIHALIDALLGATGQGDIGGMFGASDPKYKGVKSTELLRKTMPRLKGHRIVNMDSVVMAEEPKLASHIPKMRRTLAAILKIPASRVNVKATTGKGLGDIGGKKAIGAQVVVQVEKK